MDGKDADLLRSSTEFFKPLEDQVSHFAKRYELQVRKYPRSEPVWDLGFLHPGGGLGQLFILKDGDDHVAISATWQQIDFAQGTNRVRRSELLRLVRNDPDFTYALERALNTCIQWDGIEWTTVTTGLADYFSGSQSKEAWARTLSKYRLPRLPGIERP